MEPPLAQHGRYIEYMVTVSNGLEASKCPSSDRDYSFSGLFE